MPMARILVLLRPDQVAALKRVADGRSLAEMIRQGVDLYLKAQHETKRAK